MRMLRNSMTRILPIPGYVYAPDDGLMMFPKTPLGETFDKSFTQKSIWWEKAYAHFTREVQAMLDIKYPTNAENDAENDLTYLEKHRLDGMPPSRMMSLLG
jgi:hypothetical protein